MNKKLCKTLEAIFQYPTPSNLEWRRIEALFLTIGAELIEDSGSRVQFVMKDLIATFHRPHPQKEAKPYQADAKDFLAKIGLRP